MKKINLFGKEIYKKNSVSLRIKEQIEFTKNVKKSNIKYVEARILETDKGECFFEIKKLIYSKDGIQIYFSPLIEMWEGIEKVLKESKKFKLKYLLKKQ